MRKPRRQISSHSSRSRSSTHGSPASTTRGASIATTVHDPSWVMPFPPRSFAADEPIPVGIVEHPENLDLVNWVVNQEFLGNLGPTGVAYTTGDIQIAIWSLLEDRWVPVDGPWTQANVDEILRLAALHEGFVPGCGEDTVVIIAPLDEMGAIVSQIMIIQVPVPCGEGDETIWGAQTLSTGGTRDRLRLAFQWEQLGHLCQVTLGCSHPRGNLRGTGPTRPPFYPSVSRISWLSGSSSRALREISVFPNCTGISPRGRALPIRCRLQGGVWGVVGQRCACLWLPAPGLRSCGQPVPWHPRSPGVPRGTQWTLTGHTIHDRFCDDSGSGRQSTARPAQETGPRDPHRTSRVSGRAPPDDLFRTVSSTVGSSASLSGVVHQPTGLS